MATRLYFPHGFTLGLGPGKAAFIRIGDVVKIPDEHVDLLKNRFGATDKIPAGAEEVAFEKRMLPAAEAERLSHPLVEARLKPTQTEMLAAAIRELSAAQKRA